MKALIKNYITTGSTLELNIENKSYVLNTDFSNTDLIGKVIHLSGLLRNDIKRSIRYCRKENRDFTCFKGNTVEKMCDTIKAILPIKYHHYLYTDRVILSYLYAKDKDSYYSIDINFHMGGITPEVSIHIDEAFLKILFQTEAVEGYLDSMEIDPYLPLMVSGYSLFKNINRVNRRSFYRYMDIIPNYFTKLMPTDKEYDSHRIANIIKDATDGGIFVNVNGIPSIGYMNSDKDYQPLVNVSNEYSKFIWMGALIQYMVATKRMMRLVVDDSILFSENEKLNLAMMDILYIANSAGCSFIIKSNKEWILNMFD